MRSILTALAAISLVVMMKAEAAGGHWLILSGAFAGLAATFIVAAARSKS